MHNTIMGRSSIATTVFFIALALSTSAEAFVASPLTVSKSNTAATMQLNALYQNWVPKTTDFADLMVSGNKGYPQTAGFVVTEEEPSSSSHGEPVARKTRTIGLLSRTKTEEARAPPPSRGPGFWAVSTAAALLVAFAALPQASVAVSGGGLDFAGLDISNQDFSNSNYKGKDFTQVLARNTNFSGSNFAGCRFPKAYLINANYEGADIRGVSFEGTNMENVNLKNAIASGAYFGATIIDAANVENADFSDAQFPPKTLALMCDRPDMKGTNPTTGVDTRESAMCP